MAPINGAKISFEFHNKGAILEFFNDEENITKNTMAKKLSNGVMIHLAILHPSVIIHLAIQPSTGVIIHLAIYPSTGVIIHLAIYPSTGVIIHLAIYPSTGVIIHLAIYPSIGVIIHMAIIINKALAFLIVKNFHKESILLVL